MVGGHSPYLRLMPASASLRSTKHLSFTEPQGQMVLGSRSIRIGAHHNGEPSVALHELTGYERYHESLGGLKST